MLRERPALHRTDGRSTSRLFTAPRARRCAVQRFDAGTGRRVLGPVRREPQRRFSPCCRTSDGRRMVVAGDGEITVRDAATRGPGRYRTPAGPPLLDRLRTESRRSHAGDRRARTARCGSSTCAAGDRARPPAATTPRGRAVHRDGRWLLTTASDRTTDPLGRPARRRPARRCRARPGSIFSPRVTRDGRTLYYRASTAPSSCGTSLGARRLGRPFKIGAAGTSQAQPRQRGRPADREAGRTDGAISIAGARTLRRAGPSEWGRDGSISSPFVPGSHLLVVGSDSASCARRRRAGACRAAPARSPRVHLHAGDQRRRAPAGHRHELGTTDGAALVAAGRAAAGAPLRFPARGLRAPS